MKSKALLAIILACLCMTGCVNTASVIDPTVTIPPEPTATPESTPTPAPTPDAAELDMADLSSAYDELGVLISTADHFEQYVTFRNIQVYEQYVDTFMDAIAVNEYPDTLVCAVDITFYDEEKNVIASSHVHTRDGQYVLRLQPGDNAIYATVDTDMSLTDKEFVLDFNEGLDVLPE
ncbi:MAG: hypothetical protein IKU32_05115 [Clostridia bacterium]|nr:hypothetical protein [Clostridia bacterium]